MEKSSHVGVIEKGASVPFGLCHSVFSPVFSRGGGVADTNTRECSALGHLTPGAQCSLWPPHPQMPAQIPGPVDCAACDSGPEEENLGKQ